MHCAAQGGHIEVIKFLLPLFGKRVHEKTNDSYTMLHVAALCGHCQVARYLIDEVHLDPQERDKVRGVPRDCAGFSIYKTSIGNHIFLAVTDIPEVSPVASIMLWLVTAYVMLCISSLAGPNTYTCWNPSVPQCKYVYWTFGLPLQYPVP